MGPLMLTLLCKSMCLVVVDENVDAAIGVEGACDHRRNVLFVTDICLHGDGLAASRFDLLHGLMNRPR